MLKYIGKRFFTSLITIWVVITVTFFLMRLMPGGPFDGEKCWHHKLRLIWKLNMDLTSL